MSGRQEDNNGNGSGRGRRDGSESSNRPDRRYDNERNESRSSIRSDGNNGNGRDRRDGSESTLRSNDRYGDERSENRQRYQNIEPGPSNRLDRRYDNERNESRSSMRSDENNGNGRDRRDGSESTLRSNDRYGDERSDNRQRYQNDEPGPSNRPDNVRHAVGKGEKRGRDQDDDSENLGRQEKSQKRAPVRRKNRDVFVDQIVTIPVDLTTKDGSRDGDTTVKLKANFFPISTLNPEGVCVYAYRVDFEPFPEDKRLRRYLLAQHRQMLGAMTYDEMNLVHLMRKLPNDITELVSPSREGEFKVTLKFTNFVNFTSANYNQVLNLVPKNAFRALQLVRIKRNDYDFQAEIAIPQHRIRAIPGYLSSIRFHDFYQAEQNVGQNLMNVELIHKILRTQTVLEFITECHRQDRGNWKKNATMGIVGQTVMTIYNNETYRVDDINWDMSPSSTFESKTGPKTLLDYYRTKYTLPQHQIRDHRQPLLISKASARNIRAGQAETICLIPELCTMTGLMDHERKNFRLMSDLAQITRQQPNDRVRRLLDFSRRFRNNPESAQVFRENGMIVSDRLVEFDGRRLAQETIGFGNNRRYDLRNSKDKADWTFSLSTSVLYKPSDVLCDKRMKWYFIYPRECEDSKNTFMREFKTVAKGLDPRGIEEPQLIALDKDQNQEYIRKINQVMSLDPSFIMIMVTNDKADRYASIKTLTLRSDRTVSTQLIKEQTISRGKNLKSIATKVAIQVHCKLGGIPWQIDVKLDNILVVGYDVCRDTVKKSLSFGAMVANLNPLDGGGKYFTTVSKDNNGDEKYTALGVSLMTAINAFHEYYGGNLPARILIYRDGAGDGDIPEIIDQELNDILQKVRSLYSKHKRDEPKLSFVLINKKTNARIFRADRNGHSNPLPGTVVDSTITMKERYDFYLVSQSVGQGTVSPIYYNVLHDGFFKNRPDILQQMTFKLCHTYFNWSGTTKIPAVVQYAKKLAALVGQYMHVTPSANIPIDRQLYFL